MKKSEFPAFWAALTGDDELSTRYTLRVMTAAGLNAARTGHMRPIDIARFLIARLGAQTQKDIPGVLAEYSAMRGRWDFPGNFEPDGPETLLDAIASGIAGEAPLFQVSFHYPSKVWFLAFDTNPSQSADRDDIALRRMPKWRYPGNWQVSLVGSQHPVTTSRSVKFPIVRRLIEIAKPPLRTPCEENCNGSN